jgi:hypothetical protein
MKEYYGNYLGICINSQDPESRGRVQIFIPHIMPALYEGWNESGEDITIECVGNNLPNGLRSDIVNKLVQILPWAEAASPVIGSSVAGAYNPSTGNFNQTSTPEGTDVSLSLDTPTAEVGLNGAISVNANGKVNEGQFLGYLEQQIAKSKLNGYKPADAAKFGIDGSPKSWANYFYHLSYRESSHSVNTVGDVGLFAGNSNGLFQLSPNDAVNYRLNNSKPFSQEQLRDPVTNTNAAIAITERLVLRDGAIGSDRKTGAARYWGPLSKGWTPPRPATFDINNPASVPTTSPAQAHPFSQPEPQAFVGREPSQSALTDVNNVTPVSSTSKGAGINAAVAKASSQVGSIYGTSYKGKCGKATRGLANAALGLNGHFGPMGPIGGSAKDTIGKNYWEKGGYYERISTNNYVPQEGDVGITTGGEHGHAKIVLNGRFRSDNLNDSAANLAGSSTAAVYRLTPKGQELFAATNIGDVSALGQPAPDIPNNNAPDNTGAAGDDVSSGIVKNPTSSITTDMDMTGVPQGMFAYPAPGALLWVFFREGDPLFPVYFAASYGATEWQNAQKASSPPLYGPQAGQQSEFNNQSMYRPNNAGAIVFTDSATSEKNNRTVRVAHANSGYFELHPTGTTHYSPNEHIQQVAGTNYNYCLNREEWTQGTDNRVTIGNQWVVIGNPSQANFETIEALTEKVKQINAKMLQK